jgi:hypothetical protein
VCHALCASFDKWPVTSPSTLRAQHHIIAMVFCVIPVRDRKHGIHFEVQVEAIDAVLRRAVEYSWLILDWGFREAITNTFIIRCAASTDLGFHASLHQALELLD